MGSPQPIDHAVAQLCPACGLCCNGVLFGDVELQPNENPTRLKQLGLALQRKGRKLAFPQPCPCFDGALCRVYAQRPARCRAFECGLLKRVKAGQTDAAAALKRIARTRRQAQAVRELMRQLGDQDEHLPLSRRFARIMSEPIDLAADEDRVDLRARLMLEVDAFMKELHKHFLA
jgi:hypothetical protein